MRVDRKPLLVVLVVAAIACGAPPPAGTSGPTTSGERFAARTWSFDADAVGALPSGTTSFAGQWAVRAEGGAPSPPNALCQTASAEFPAMQLAPDTHRDMSVSARFKLISGRTDQAAGVLLRV